MEDETKTKMQALKNIVEQRRNEAQKSRINASDRSMNLAKGDLDKDVFKVSGGSLSPDVSEPVTKIRTGTDVVDTKQIQKLSNSGDFEKRMKDLDLKQKLKSSFKAAAESGDDQMMDKLRKIASKMGTGARTGLKSVPLIGGVAAAALGGAEDASAAIPVLDSADSVGMSSQDENQMISEIKAKNNYEKSQARKDALAKLAKSGQ